ncbi:MAG: TadE/TadG family type IV pilus assembly protein [Chloroflexota bacterium]
MRRRPAWAGTERARESAGQGLPEFALVLPILVLLIFGLLDLGRAIYAANAVANAARMGARTAIVNQNPLDVSTRAAGQATALGIDPAADCTSTTGVCVDFQNSSQTAACSTLFGPDLKSCVAVVTVKYTFTAFTPIIGTILGPIPITSTSIQALESQCTGAGQCPIP